MKTSNNETKLLLVLGLIVVLGGGALLGINRLLQPPPPPSASEKVTASRDVFDKLTKNARHVKGSPDAPVTVLEFADFQCPACRSAYDTLVKRFDSDKIRLIYRHLPLPDHEAALPAAIAAEAAARQGKFWEMYAALFDPGLADPPRDLERGYFVKSAKKVGLDVARFERDLKDPALEALVKSDVELARSNRLDTTPSFFVRDGSGDIAFVTGVRQLTELMTRKKLLDAKDLAYSAAAPAPPAR